VTATLAPSAASVGSRALGWWASRRFGSASRHWPMLVLLAAGAVLRLLTVLAYQPALLWIDSLQYLDNIKALRPDGHRPIGYELILNALLLFGDLRFVAVVQHVLGLGIAVAIYGLLLRHGARRWLAALATAPVLLDAYQVQIEHNILSEVWFDAILVAIIGVLTWRGLPTPWRAGVAGILIGFSVMMRLVGVTMLVPAVVYLVVAGSLWGTGSGWRQVGRRVAAITVGFALVMVGYVGYFRAVVGGWSLAGSLGNVLYGRAVTVVDCEQFPLGSSERALCPPLARDQRLGAEYYMWAPDAPLNSVVLPPGEEVNAVQRSFWWHVLLHQPLDFGGGILTDFVKGFRPVRVDAHNDVPVDRWQFQVEYPYFAIPAEVDALALQFGNVLPAVNKPIAKALRSYQLTVGYVPGPLLGLTMITGFVASLGVGRSRSSGIRGATLLVSSLGITVLLTAAITLFSWRYQLPGLVLLPMAGALGATAFTGPLRRPGPRRKVNPPMQPYPDPVDTATVSEFISSQGEMPFAPVVVIIAAYNEEDGIGAVLAAVPPITCGLPVDTLVIVDGSTDSTAEVARRCGARVCEMPANRGQGAALRLGYALARVGGARYMVTTDADGQYDMAELPLLLQPLIDDEADFVTGSRALGRRETSDPVRHLGVHVFAWLASTLTRQPLTDTSFGFRAMKAEVTEAVTLTQAQYQASELLLGTIARGYRVLEQPMTMLARTAGQTKKGNNFIYGMRYARVLVGTWLREFWARGWRSSAPKTNRSSSANLSTKTGR
jgi:hypothetical protein